jgi:hypothetical protein
LKPPATKQKQERKKNLSIGRTFKSLHDEKEDDSGEGKILRGVAAGNGNRLHIERGQKKWKERERNKMNGKKGEE